MIVQKRTSLLMIFLFISLVHLYTRGYRVILYLASNPITVFSFVIQKSKKQHVSNKKSIIVLFRIKIIQQKNQRKNNDDSLAEWLRRQTRNLMGQPAQVQILQLSIFLIFFLLHQHLLMVYFNYFVMFKGLSNINVQCERV